MGILFINNLIKKCNMKSKSFIIGSIIVLAVGGYFAGTMFSKKSGKKDSPANFERTRSSNFSANFGQDGPADFRGRVQEVGEAEMTIEKFEDRSDSFGDMSGEERRERMQSLSEEERQALRQDRQNANEERQIVGEETVSISSETKIFEGSTRRRSEGDSPSEPKEILLSDIENGAEVTVWTKDVDDGRIEAEVIMVLSRNN